MLSFYEFIVYNISNQYLIKWGAISVALDFSNCPGKSLLCGLMITIKYNSNVSD